MSEWKDISTDKPPMDGTPFLAIGDLDLCEPHYEVVFFYPSSIPGITDADGIQYPGKDWCWATTDGPTFHERTFKFWMPLPSPPTTQER